jgi:hypothetical protein
MWNMGAVATFITDRFQRAIPFVLVNNPVPRMDQHSTLCGRLIEKGYIRNSQTRLVYCDAQCFIGGTHEAPPSSKIVEGKRHEMFKPALLSWNRSCLLSARLVWQATLLFKALSRRAGGA